MVELPGPSAYGPDDRAGTGEEQGWGSPVPPEYGSLHAVEPPPTSGDGVAPDQDRDRWEVTSLLRRVQGELRDDRPAAEKPPPPRRGTSFTGLAPVRSRSSDPALLPRIDPDVAKPATDAPKAAPPAPRIVPDGVPPQAPTGVTSEWVPLESDPAVVPPIPDVAVSRRRRRSRRPVRVRSRATVRHIDILTVVRVSIVFWLVMLVSVVVASVLLWLSADVFGVLPSIEKSVRTLFSLKTFVLNPGTVALYTGAVGVVLAVAGTLANVLFALIYNLIADVVGGVRVELESLQTE